MRSWGWAVPYGIGIFLAMALGTILGGISLFKETSLGGTRLTAADVVHFMGYGGTLLVVWLLAQRAAVQLPESGSALSFLRQVDLPLATLIVFSAGYQVLLLLVGPFLNETATTIYNWIFVLGIVSAALWLAVIGCRSSTLLIETVAAPEHIKTSPSACPKCGVTVGVGQKFCSQCGQSLAPTVCRRCSQPLGPGQKFCGICGTPVGQLAA